MDESRSPYQPPRIIDNEASANSLWPGIALSLVTCVFNFVLGAFSFNSEMLEFGRWGAYVGEYIVLLTWLAWGIGPLLKRAATCGALGILWMLSSWLGFAFARPDIVRSYSHEFSQIFTVAPLSFGLSSIPLFMMQKRFISPSGEKDRSSGPHKLLASQIVIGLICLFMVIAIYSGRAELSDLGVSIVIALVMALVSSVASLLFSNALLKERLRLYIIFCAFFAVPFIGMVISRLFAMPGSGPAEVFYATAESACALAVAMCPVLAAFSYWRWCGIRVVAAKVQ